MFVFLFIIYTFPYILGGSWTILIKHLNFGWLWWLFTLFYHKIYSKIKIGFSKGGRVTILQNIVTKFCSFLTMAFSPDNIHKCVFEALSHWAGFSVFFLPNRCWLHIYKFSKYQFLVNSIKSLFEFVGKLRFNLDLVAKFGEFPMSSLRRRNLL